MVTFDDSFSNSQINDLRMREEERIVQANAPRLGFEYINLQDRKIDPLALQTMLLEKAKAAGVVAFGLDKQTLSIAAKNPTSPAAQAAFQDLQNRRFELVVYMCSTASLAYGWDRYKDISQSTAQEKGVFMISTGEVVEMINNIKQPEDVVKELKKIGTSNNSRKISQTVALIFAGALALRASDIHIEPEDAAIRIRYRLDGVLHDIIDVDKYLYQRIMSRLKLLSGMVLNTKSEAQDGRFTFNTGEREVEVRSSMIPGAHGESSVLRILDPTVASFSMEKINLNPYIDQALRQQLKKPDGLIVTTGPTGSGKTTALYAFLREIHNETKKIITIENPVEYKIDGVVHTQTGPDYTFASGLRAILRQDPDVILVGEIRDKEVAETALHAAQTGHLVLSTLHTNNAVAGFTRLIDLGIDPRVLGTSINMIVGQRLVRLLCVECKVSYQATAKEEQLVRNILSEHPFPPSLPTPIILHKAVGCTVCGNTGYKGRAGIFEGVVMDNAVEEVVLRDPREYSILQAAKPQKIPTMLQDGLEKAVHGLTSLTELERVIEFPELSADTQTTPTEVPPVSDADFAAHIV